MWAVRRGVYLRLAASRNNQRRLVRWAEEYEIDARLSASGPIAQLGERLAGSQKVGGSSPPGSIPSSMGDAESAAYRTQSWSMSMAIAAGLYW